ncbi:hypothetical protein L1049_007409 [Liquidambar formosana]|uniref:Uncharacterized protein n=1 Tax=Liquidambar formosana TaxID=63359 RepID=A0AAP0N1P6_LIQFO
MPIQCLFFFLLLVRSAFAIPQSTEFKKYAGDPRLFSENRVLKINFSNIGTSESAAEVIFSPEPGQDGPAEIIGLSVSSLGSSVFINVRNRGLFAYMLRGQLLWSAGPVFHQSGYRQGCKNNLTECYFTSVPVIDRCEASVYVRGVIFPKCFLFDQ